VNVFPAIVMVAERPGPVVAAALYCTSPLPVPLAPDAIVSHGALLAAVQAQPAGAVTATRPVPPAAGCDADSGEIENTQPGDCVNVMRCPATVVVPVREGPEVAATSHVMLPLPLPDDAPCGTIQDTSDVELHGQPLPVVTVTVTAPPSAPTDGVAGETA
jgi:hypothetical protein